MFPSARSPTARPSHALAAAALAVASSSCDPKGPPGPNAGASATSATGNVPLGAPAPVQETELAASPPTSRCAPEPITSCSLDIVGGAAAVDVTRVVRDAPVRVIGWAADGARRSIPPVIVLELAGPQSFYAPADRLTPRPDVAAALGSPALERAGYDAALSFRRVPSGRYAFKVLQVSADGAALECDTGRKLEVQ